MTDPQPRFHWILPNPHPLSGETIDDARRRGLSARALRVLSRRGPVDVSTLAALFDDPRAGLHDPGLLPDADLVLGRVAAARARGEAVMVLGDFDADGLTGLAILTAALQRLGLEVEPYVPDRTAEGHGLSAAAVEHAATRGHALIVTADTGSTSVAEVEAARLAGIDVIITDHHVLGPDAPRAYALVNPQRADSRYPDARLSGAGVAFKVAQLLLADEPGGAELALGLADLAAVGAIADVVPMLGENRAIVRLGLRRMETAPRPGIAALLAARRVDKDVSAEDVAFGLAPRLNAMGRIGDPSVAARLLLSADPKEARQLAAELEAANRLRRDLTAQALDEARAVLAASPLDDFTVIAGDWPVGVIGLLAGRLAEETGRPALVLSSAVEPWRGSARSAGGVDLAAALATCADLLERHGGHPAAAGCHVAAERVPELRQRLIDIARRGSSVDPRAGLRVDLIQSALAADHVLLQELAPLELAGEEPPLVGIAGLVVVRVRAASGGHVQLTLRKGRDVIDGIGFGRADLAAQVKEGQEIDVVARLGARVFAGLETLQLDVRDVAAAGTLSSLHEAGRRPLAATPVTPEAVPAGILAQGQPVLGHP
jgi:single-stranded-DNA-specific exonuclease